jgi:hypothetical protein
MKVGVLIPSRGDRSNFLNHAKWLLEQQTRKTDEVLIVDYPPKSNDYDITPRYRLDVKNYLREDVILFSFGKTMIGIQVNILNLC